MIYHYCFLFLQFKYLICVVFLHALIVGFLKCRGPRMTFRVILRSKRFHLYLHEHPMICLWNWIDSLLIKKMTFSDPFLCRFVDRKVRLSDLVTKAVAHLLRHWQQRSHAVRNTEVVFEAHASFPIKWPAHPRHCERTSEIFTKLNADSMIKDQIQKSDVTDCFSFLFYQPENRVTSRCTYSFDFSISPSCDKITTFSTLSLRRCLFLFASFQIDLELHVDAVDSFRTKSELQKVL